MTTVRVAPDPAALAERVARVIAQALGAAVEARGGARLALSGGHTPRALYERLGAPDGPPLPGGSTDLFWADERFVPADHPDSNYRLVRESLLAHGRFSPERIHPVPTGAVDLEAAARAYESELRAYLPADGPALDLVVLGIGPDGHTASLFPDDPALAELHRWVVAVPRAGQPPRVPRVSLSLPLLNRCRRVLFLVTGEDKAEIVRTALEAPGDGDERLPAARVHGTEATEWYLDAAAARALSDRPSPA
jgi:6-phosphogluconolactonase